MRHQFIIMLQCLTEPESRIEDDILITEDGCEVLSENLMRDPDQIEAFMQEKEA